MNQSEEKRESYMGKTVQIAACTRRMVPFANCVLLILQHLALACRSTVSADDHHLHHSLLQDKAALLSFRSSIVSDPGSRLANWLEEVNVCNFTGATCNELHHPDRLHHRVVNLNLSSFQLTGPLSPVLSNLTGLRNLSLDGNHFFGTIPPELSYLRHLNYLKLDMNDLHGPLPESLSLLRNLTLLTIINNNLSGDLPASLFSNCTLLFNVELAGNSFTGKIPEEIGNCPNLWNLVLFDNKFSGQLPKSLANLSLYNLDVENNHLEGELPVDMVSKQPYLVYLHLSYNNMVSHDNNTNLEPFFRALRNCTELVELELGGMALGGRIPSSIGQLHYLNALSLQENRISGPIPTDLAALTSLTLLNLSSNLLNGTIPEEFSKMSNLEQLFLSSNFLTDAIPSSLGRLHHLGLLDLSNNLLSGEIPSSFGNLTRLQDLFLSSNLLSGTIPATLGKCTELYKLDLSFNMLTGIIPPEILLKLQIRIFLNVSNNKLDGPLPIELSKLENAQEIDVSSNNFTGSIFPQISGCIAVRVLKFSDNSLQGHLPDSLGDLRNLESLDISNNDISGKIPASLNKVLSLTFINFSCNNLEGPIPTGGVFNTVTFLSFIGNHLCGRVPGIRACSTKKHYRSLIIVIVIILASVFSATACCVVAIRHAKLMNSEAENARKLPATELIHNFPRITYRELSESTGGFADQSLIGKGSYGRVFRGVLPDGTIVAVKVLHLQTGNSTKSFNRECQVLKRIRHRNLMRIITACSLPDFKALVLPYMANGSLDSRLYPNSDPGSSSGSSDLTLIQRLNICSDVAEGMAYLHHHSPVKVIHCDLKPSNVLLNDDMTALVSDFGIARLIMTVAGGNGGIVENMGSSTANLLCGSIGYIAPEYGFGSSTSTKGDVYSFGVVVLEMMTRKRPTDDMFSGGLNLHRWVRNHYHGRVERVLDPSLVRASRDQSGEVKRMWEVAIGEMIELGILCTQEAPSTRPTMLDAADDLDRLKRYLGGDTTATFASSLGIASSTFGDD